MEQNLFENKPNLFIVGFAKAGTTSLHHYLSKHPQIFMTRLKEPRFFCFDLHRESDEFHGAPKFFPIRTFEQYARLFEEVSDEKIIGESSPDYLYSFEAPSNICNFNPEAKIIIMLREPISQMKSLFLEVYSGLRGDDVESLEGALELEPVRKRGKKIPKTARMPSTLYYRRNAHYLTFIRRYLKFFQQENIHFIALEEIERSAKKVRIELFNFLEIEQINLDFETRNQRKDKLYIRNKAFIVSITNYLKFVHPRIAQLFLTLFRGIIQVRDISEMVRLDDQFLENLKLEFMSEVIELSDITGIDLIELWNYK